MPSRPAPPASITFWTLGLIWGTNFMFMKWATDVISPSQTTLLRVLCGFLPIAAYALARRALRWQHLRHAHHFLVMSALATSVYYYAFAAGTARLPSGIAGALSGSIPLFSALAALVFLRSEPLTRKRLAGVVAGFAGVLLIARPWAAEGGADLAGVGFMTVGALSVGLSFVYARRFLSPLGIPAAALTTYQVGLAGLTLLLLVDLDGITALAGDSRAAIGTAVGLGLLGTGVAYVLYYQIIEQLGAVTASGATYIPPAVSLLIGWLLLGERISLLDAGGLVVLLTGVLLLRGASKRQLRAKAARSASP